MVTPAGKPRVAGGARRAAFLDRDGVLTRALVRDGRPYAPVRLEDFEILPGVAEAVEALRQAGFAVIVATNQPDVAKGLLARPTLEAMHRMLRERIPVDDIRVCDCVEGPACPCYKPKPGLILDAAVEWGLDLARSFMVGDRWRDIGAGKAAGCRTIFVDRGYNETLRDRPDHVVRDLPEAVRLITQS
jgi:D-glycero-D-manno-heptose 1,7-bisphosphate phosphatase